MKYNPRPRWTTREDTQSSAPGNNITGNRAHTATLPWFISEDSQGKTEDLLINGEALSSTSRRRHPLVEFTGALYNDFWRPGKWSTLPGYSDWLHPFFARRQNGMGDLSPFTIAIGGMGGSALEGLSMSLLVPPSNMSLDIPKDLDAVKTRLGVLVSANISDPATITFSGKSPAMVTMMAGLSTWRSRYMSTACMNLVSISTIFKNNGANHVSFQNLYGIDLAKMRYDHVPGREPEASSYVTGVLDTAMIEYDGTLYFGSFNSFSFSEDASNPYLFSYNISFTILGVFGDTMDGHIGVDGNRDSRRVIVDHNSIQGSSLSMRDYAPTINPETIGFSRADIVGITEQSLKAKEVTAQQMVAAANLDLSNIPTGQAVTRLTEFFSKYMTKKDGLAAIENMKVCLALYQKLSPIISDLPLEVFLAIGMAENTFLTTTMKGAPLYAAGFLAETLIAIQDLIQRYNSMWQQACGLIGGDVAQYKGLKWEDKNSILAAHTGGNFSNMAGILTMHFNYSHQALTKGNVYRTIVAYNAGAGTLSEALSGKSDGIPPESTNYVVTVDAWLKYFSGKPLANFISISNSNVARGYTRVTGTPFDGGEPMGLAQPGFTYRPNKTADQINAALRACSKKKGGDVDV